MNLLSTLSDAIAQPASNGCKIQGVWAQPNKHFANQIWDLIYKISRCAHNGIACRCYESFQSEIKNSSLTFCGASNDSNASRYAQLFFTEYQTIIWSKKSEFFSESTLNFAPFFLFMAKVICNLDSNVVICNCDFFVNSRNYGCLKVFLDAYQVRGLL